MNQLNGKYLNKFIYTPNRKIASINIWINIYLVCVCVIDEANNNEGPTVFVIIRSKLLGEKEFAHCYYFNIIILNR